MNSDLIASPAIYRLSISRFRGIEALDWWPAKGVNVILGGGDAGKSTILDAIALLLSPVNPSNLSDPDYHRRDVEAGFSIEAVVSLPPSSGINGQSKPYWPWEWNGKEAVAPNLDQESGVDSAPVYVARVRGTEDLELVYELLQPDGSADSFPVALRRSIGLVRLAGDDRNDRDLRLVYGSALDRLLSDKGLRSRMASEVSKSDVKDELSESAQTALTDLDKTFQKESLPAKLDLAITGGQGASIASMIGLTADREGVQLPLASWGAGTRRLSALAIAEHNQGDAPIMLVDEVERGLEPYRQRPLVEKLEAGSSQVFLTTHSPAAISAAGKSNFWYMDHAGSVGPLDRSKIARHRETDPETFLSCLAIIAEGATEAGFLSALLARALNGDIRSFGIYISDGGGHETTLGLLEALAAGGLKFAGFADDEGKHPERWQRLRESLGPLLFRWSTGCIEENVIGATPENALEKLVVDPDGTKTGVRLRHLADRLEIQDKHFDAVRAAAGSNLKSLVIGAALGSVPDGKNSEKKVYKAHASSWFKSTEGGHELARKAFELDLWPNLKPELLPFCNAVRTAIGLQPLSDFPA